MSTAQHHLFEGDRRLVLEEAIELTIQSLATKRCCRCRTEHPVAMFGRSRRDPDGLRPECKECRRGAYAANAERLRAKQTAYYHANRAERRQAQSRYNAIHAERIMLKMRAHRASMSPEQRLAVADTKRRWAAANCDKVRAANRAWRAANIEQLRERARSYLAGRAEVRNAYERDLRRRNPGWERSKKHARRARLRSAGRFTAAQWTSICHACDGRCLSCRQKATLTVDHIVPLAAGGPNVIENVQPLCGRCNSRKGTRTIDYRPVWLRELVAAKTWPDRWDGTEPTGDVVLDTVYGDGSVQPVLFGRGDI